jgi:hypothetical protein
MAVATRKLLALVAIVALIGVLIGVYVVDLTNGPTPYRLPVAVGANGEKTVNLTLQTVAAIGPNLSPNENWSRISSRSTACGIAARCGRCRPMRSSA